jgi:hypothetical protein
MKLSNKRLWLFGAIAIGAIILITFISAPANNKLNSGSTYSRAPDGYGAWYAFMSERGTPVQRWRKPFEDLTKNQNIKSPITLLRVYSNRTYERVYRLERKWVEDGNTLVILGVRQPVTKANFTTKHQTESGIVKIETQRRQEKAKEKLLADSFGAIVWQESIGKGKVIYSSTPYLGANAYQDFQGNYEFLAQLVTQSLGEQASSLVGKTILIQNPNSYQRERLQNQVWVDEYIHGYKDKEILKREHKENIFSYLAKTPLFPAFIQGLVLLLVAIWANNRRLGKPISLSTPEVNNSEAYIQALASVLHKANSTEFILEVVGKEEQIQLQKSLCLGQNSLDNQTLINAWVQQTGLSKTEIEQLLLLQSKRKRISEVNLLTWLSKWEQIRRNLPSYGTEKKNERN